MSLFPHRIAPEKQHDIFTDLDTFSHYKFITAQDKELTKTEYLSNYLQRARWCLVANLQETLGISWYEGAPVGAVPFKPDRLSYL